MSKFERIAVLDDAFQAQLLSAELEKIGIPHVIRSYHDTAYDGLFQVGSGYGCVEAAPEHADRVRAVLQDISRPAPQDRS